MRIRCAFNSIRFECASKAHRNERHVKGPLIIFCQQLWEAKVEWDEPLTGDLLSRWKQLLAMLQCTEVVTIPRCVYHGFDTTRPVYFNLVGFCDASSKAYAAVVYARMQDDSRFIVEFLSAKTRVTPISGSSIPCLELFYWPS